MEYELIAERNNISLILRGINKNEYAVVKNLNKEKAEWDYTIGYYGFGYYYPGTTKEKALFKAIDLFISKTDKRHISYDRMSEIASIAIDEYVSAFDRESFEFCESVLELNENEFEYFGLKKDLEVLL